MKTKKMALMFSLLLIAGLAAGCSGGKDNKGTAEEGAEGGTEGGKPVTFSWLVYDRTEGKVRDDWEIFKEIEAKTGVKIDFQVVGQEGIEEKKQIMIATNSVTDFIQVSTQEGREHGPENVFLNLGEYLDIAPNLKAFYDSYPEAKAVATGPDGGIYTVPVLEGDPEGKGFNFVWMARKDVLEEAGIKPPATLDEFYQMLKTLKEKFPDSYPLTANSPIGDTGLYTVFGRAFTGIQGFFNLDPETDEYAFAPYRDGYREALEYLNRLYAEKLLDPEYSLLTGAQWEERILSGKSFLSYFWKADIAPLTEKGRTASGNENFELDAIPQFAAEGIRNYQYSRPLVGGVGRAISAKVKDKEAAVKFLDYLVGDEGSDYLSLGILGKTYTIEDGKPVFMKEFGSSPYVPLRRDYGVWYDHISLNNAKARAAWENGLDEKSKAINASYEPYIIPAPKAIVKTEEEMELEKSRLNNLNKYLEQQITEFVTGKTPINDETYQRFLDQAKKLGADDLLNMYNTAYKRTYGSK
ncbi:sugar ABC transporter permease [Paenibacillus cisolokensis]|uniref:Sugar ABC transporter permease n=2 Tax=Paenibacillus cisolokensis TaxID=1658519 RepID=A0ABQ4NDZ7_9BACL|nr:extracellular solute-binding protein [Paenibacillus cisolokensis]GIQ66427.1 sugar ABC transporter permease [Paenibacillus cisolokensis]